VLFAAEQVHGTIAIFDDRLASAARRGGFNMLD
jgi:hypothetical protein